MKNKVFNKIPIWILMLLLTVFISVGSATYNDGEFRQNGKFTVNGVIQELDTATDGTSLCFEGTTSDAFETCFLFTDPTADRTVTFGDSSFSAGATNAHSAITSITVTDTTTNVVTDLLVIDHSGGDTTTGFGTGISFKSEDDTGTTTEEHASIDVVITDGTSTTEESDMVFNVMSNGDVSEQFRLVSAESGTTGDYFQFTSNTTEVNGEITTGTFKLLSVGTEAAGLGATHEYWMVDAGGSEIQAEFATVFTTVTDGQEDVDLVWRQNDNGTVSESMRLVADTDGTVEGTRLEITSRSAETNGVNDLLVLKASGGTTVAGFGVGIDMQAEFADGVETAGKIEAVWTDVSTGTEDADVVFSAKDAGATVELVRFDSDGNVLLEGATADGIQTILASEATTADKTITLPDATGTAYLTSGVGNYRPTASQAAATDTLVLSDCGITQLLNRAAGIVITLPAATDGCWLKFIVATAPTGTTTVVTPGAGASLNIIQGGIATGEDAAGSVVTAADADTITFATNLAIKGDWAEVFSDGTSWFVSGMTSVQDGMTTTQAN